MSIHELSGLLGQDVPSRRGLSTGSSTRTSSTMRTSSTTLTSLFRRALSTPSLAGGDDDERRSKCKDAAGAKGPGDSQLWFIEKGMGGSSLARDELGSLVRHLHE